MISTNLRIIAIAGSFALLVFVVELVRRRRLKEEYSVLWVATALTLLLLAAWGGLLRDLAHLIGADSQASTLYFFSIIFIAFMLLHFSVRVSNLERRVVVLLQEVALLAEHRGHPDALGEYLPAQEPRAGTAATGGRLEADLPAGERVREASVR